MKKETWWKLPGSPMVRTLHFHCKGVGSIPGQGTKIPQDPTSLVAAVKSQKNRKK